MCKAYLIHLNRSCPSELSLPKGSLFHDSCSMFWIGEGIVSQNSETAWQIFNVSVAIFARCRLVWRFAIRAVLQDLGKHRRWLTLSDLVRRRQQRLKYQQLYLKRLEKHSNIKEAPTEVAASSLQRLACSEALTYVPYMPINVMKELIWAWVMSKLPHTGARA